MITIRIATSATEMNSMLSSERVTALMSLYAKNQRSTAATSEMITQSGLSQIPMPLKNDSPNSPISAKFAARKAV
jgi:hypothetical protein